MHKRILTTLLVAACFSAAARADDPKPASMLGTEAGQVRDDNALKMKLVWCPPGMVTMEQVEEVEFTGPVEVQIVDGKPVRVDKDGIPIPVPKTLPVRAFVTRGYWLGKYEVKQSEWKQVGQTEPWKARDFTKEGDEFPATSISWDDAIGFCRRLTEHERDAGRLPDGWEYTLPTEAQWERACRAQTETKFSFGDDDLQLGEYAWCRVNTSDASENYAHRVGLKKPNAWGLHDMHGNVWEWCRDYYAQILMGGRDPEAIDIRNSPRDSGRVLRGGGWNDTCPSAYRGRNIRTYRSDSIGFRVALTAIRPAAETPPK